MLLLNNIASVLQRIYCWCQEAETQIWMRFCFELRTMISPALGTMIVVGHFMHGGDVWRRRSLISIVWIFRTSRIGAWVLKSTNMIATFGLFWMHDWYPVQQLRPLYLSFSKLDFGSPNTRGCSHYVQGNSILSVTLEMAKRSQ